MNRIWFYLLQEIYPQYLALEEYGHGVDHILGVTKNALDLNESGLLPKVKRDSIVIAAAYHDLGLLEGREGHEERSAQKFWGDRMVETFLVDSERKEIAQAIKEHRSSYQGEASSTLSKILRDADRQLDPFRMLQRYIRASAHRWIYAEHCCREIYRELTERYGPEGRLNEALISKRNKDDLEHLQRFLADKTEFVNIFMDLFKALRAPYEKEIWASLKEPMKCEVCPTALICPEKSGTGIGTMCYSYEGQHAVRLEKFYFKEECPWNKQGDCTSVSSENMSKACDMAECNIAVRCMLFPTDTINVNLL